MVRILSTGTAMNIAITTGDAGQLGIVAGFDGYLSGLISRLRPMRGLALGDSDRSDLFKGDALGGDRLWGVRFLWCRLSLVLMGCLAKGDRMGWPSPHYFSQHSVFQH
ncbi:MULTISPECIES: hypothetical protein [Cyanophyceae]|uniref:hypothetical protein n=1 Tax=Cyanophyceae TaxID=3028117 RepID=UPI0016848DFF|nr:MULTISPECIES: hypothetical protein [Cyanophyceae]MBD1916127.1 hypothetical protein [Phormidium sp. FACHB-77]MBD2031604.1 hypothetical protein [Phormidium sp. FACHB-322]MBD2052769.1 hypothetical protein [Leptolyngbya sp. FACHB-60]